MERLEGRARPAAIGYRDYVRRVIASRLLSERGWPEWLGGILLGLVNILFLAIALKPFTIYSGFLNWGQHIYTVLGLDWLTGAPKAPVFGDRTSVGDIGLFLGALLAAVAAAEFKLKRLPLRDYAEAVAGGLLMSLGVVLAFGCNWGGFFSAITALSLHGYAMFIGLVVGGYLGSRYVEWKSMRVFEEALLELEAEAQPATGRARHGGLGLPVWAKTLLVLGVAAAAASAAWIVGGPVYAAMLGLGMLVGVVLQRARFCFATAFRDVLRGAEQPRAVRLQTGIALGIIVGATGAAVLKYMGYIDPYVYIKPVALTNIVGGVLFGFGMALAGGCASGSLWKAAEGNTGLLAALLAAILSYPVFRLIREPLMAAVPHAKVFLPDLFGWLGALALVYATMVLWVLVAHYAAYRNGIDPWR